MFVYILCLDFGLSVLGLFDLVWEVGFQGVDGEAYGDTIRGKRDIKAGGKGPYGGANMNRDPHTSKNNAPSQLLPRSFPIGVGVGFSLFLFFGF
ncbi:hypothetical protein L6452_39803 [Arctium lappa]|uniref:Uncharacterized protein n=1 Tax=Arctium lappa TaxID=4217 RepID=A0ACB8XTJ4_ARCLA|nr:hypothetical protein L6452_39803 [Arctium lappa]